MESPPICAAYVVPANDSTAAGVEEEEKGKENQISPVVDQFLMEAIENPRHRLTVLRMELDLQRFMRSSDQQQFEFQHFPTSYLRCAAHRVAQHYGLQTIALDYTIDGLGNRIVVRKTPESKFPAIRLSDIASKQQPENITEKVKIAIRPRQNKPSVVCSMEMGVKRDTIRTVEEREEDCDKARARIFNGSCNPEVSFMSAADDRGYICSSTGGQESYTCVDNSDNISMKDGASRVAIFRDREKDMIDPDYDRSYNRYIKAAVPSYNADLPTCNVLQSLPLQFQEVISPMGQLPRAIPLMSYGLPNPTMNPFCAVGSNQTPLDTVYMQWPAPAIMYAHSYGQYRRATFQAPSAHLHPLSFECWQNP